MFTPVQIEDRFEEAAITLRRLPNPPGSGPKGFGNSWPEYVRDPRHAYGYHDATMKVRPNAQEIARMEQAIDWLRLLSDPIDRHIVWMRADGHRWRAVCGRVGVSRATAHRRWCAAMLTIANLLNKHGKPKGKASAEKGGGAEVAQRLAQGVAKAAE
jgi:hypothetical protein